MPKTLKPKKIPKISQAFIDERQSERLPGMSGRDPQISTVRSGSLDSFGSSEYRSPMIFQSYRQGSQSNIRQLDNRALKKSGNAELLEKKNNGPFLVRKNETGTAGMMPLAIVSKGDVISEAEIDINFGSSHDFGERENSG